MWEKQRYIYFSCDGKENNYFDPFHGRLVLCVQRGGCTHRAGIVGGSVLHRCRRVSQRILEGKRGAAVNGEQRGLSVLCQPGTSGTRHPGFSHAWVLTAFSSDLKSTALNNSPQLLE